jgi:hypothetical protein
MGSTRASSGKNEKPDAKIRAFRANRGFRNEIGLCIEAHARALQAAKNHRPGRVNDEKECGQRGGIALRNMHNARDWRDIPSCYSALSRGLLLVTT